jgi:pimeloyl-ACP methyl ester carboxylesterase
MSITTVSGHPVHYEAFGRGKPVLFVHGWLGSWRYWWPTMQALSSTHRSFAVDLWGFGDSSKSVGDYTIESQAAMLNGFIDKMGIARPFTIVGHSIGAGIAIRYAGGSATAVDRIAAVAMPLAVGHVNGQLRGKTAEDIIDQSMVKYSGYAEVVMGLEKTSPSAFEQSLDQLDELAFGDDLFQVECPILLVYGASDTLVIQPDDDHETEEPGRQNRWCVSLENCGHFPMLEQPAVFNRLLREFIDGAGPGELEPKKYWQRRTR